MDNLNTLEDLAIEEYIEEIDLFDETLLTDAENYAIEG